MRRYLFIFSVLLAYLLFCSKSCESPQIQENGSQEDELEKAMDSIKNEFEADDLSKKTLRAFETKVKEKLVDLSDYLNLYTGKSLDDTLKNQVRTMVSELFISDTVQIKMTVSAETSEKVFRLNELLNLDFVAGCDSIIFSFDSIEVAEPLHWTDEFSYAGILKFSQSVKVFSSDDASQTLTVIRNAEIFAVKVDKPFGTDTLQIWRVLLGNIE